MTQLLLCLLALLFSLSSPALERNADFWRSSFAAKGADTIAEGMPISPYRVTGPGETFIRYKSANPAFTKITPSGVKPGTFAAPASDGLIPVANRVPVYNLPSPQIPRPNATTLTPPPGTPIIGPRPVVGGTGNEVSSRWATEYDHTITKLGEGISPKPETGMGYQVVSVFLKDGKRFDQVAVVEGRITEIRGRTDVPFAEDDIAEIILTHDKWNFNAERQ